MSRRSVASDPVEIVRDALSRGVTGSLHVNGQRGERVVYVMQGEILAAHGPDDGSMVIRRLFNSGSISIGHSEQLLAALQSGETIESLLIGQVPEDLYLELLAQRFRQNLLEFVGCGGEIRFTSLEAVFVENIQTGHDSFALLEAVRDVRERTAPLQARADSLIARPGPVQPGKLTHARLLDLCEPERLVQTLIDTSPFETGATLSALSEMADQGVVQLFDVDGDGFEPASVGRLGAAPQAETQPRWACMPDVTLPPERDPTWVPHPSPTWVPDNDDIALDSPLNLPALDPAAIQPLADVDATEAPGADLPAAVLEDGPSAQSPRDHDVAQDAADPADAAIDDDPLIAEAIRRAQQIEQRREAARAEMEKEEGGVVTRPPGFDFDMPIDDTELAFFKDQEADRGAGAGKFSTEEQLLDRVDLSDAGMAAFQRAMQMETSTPEDVGTPLAMAEATEEEAAHAVTLSFTGPVLDESDVRRKIGVVNDVMAEIAKALDRQAGSGSGRLNAQLLVDGPPTRFAALFRGVKVDKNGRLSVDRLLRNLRKRPDSERRHLLNKGMLDLIQRSLSTSVEDLDDDVVDEMLEHIAGYQQRLGL